MDEHYPSIMAQELVLTTDWWLCPEISKSSERLKDVFCLGYRIGWSNDDFWTVRNYEFKKGNPQAVENAAATLRVAAPSLFRRINIDPQDTIIIPVLGSQITSSIANSKNSILADAVASGAGTKFVFDCSQKHKHEPLHRERGVQARDQALN